MRGRCIGNAIQGSAKGVQKECKGSAKHCEMLSRGMGYAIPASAKVMNTTEITNAWQVHRKAVQGRTHGIQT